MNSNVSTFGSIKYETVKYSLVMPRGLKYLLKKRYLAILHLMDTVKDKSQQIRLKFSFFDPEVLEECAGLFEGIQALTIWCQNESKLEFPFDLMKNVRSLQLFDIHTLNSAVIQTAFENVETLVLHGGNFRRIENINPKKTLKSLQISFCHSLEFVLSLDDIPHISIYYCRPWAPEFPKNCQKFEYVSTKVSFQSLQDSLSSFGSKLLQLKLVGPFLCTFSDFSFCQNIPSVELTNTADGNTPAFPIVNCEDLSLSAFSLSSWNGQFMLSFTKLELANCRDLVYFPHMTNVRVVKITLCISLKSIPILAHLEWLEVQSCNELETVSFGPLLKSLKFRDCVKLLAVPALEPNLRFLNISQCWNLKVIPNTRNISQLEIIENFGITSLVGIQGDETNYLEMKRTVSLTNLHSVQNFNFCQNIYQLSLHTVGRNLTTCEGIANIHILSITNCIHLNTTLGLNNITGSVTFDKCIALKALIGLKNIPKVHLIYCNAVSNFNGLGNNQLLHVTGVPEFEKLHNQYKLFGAHREIFEHSA
jgi:hypothetical protein